MKYFRLYFRVLELLGREARLGWVLAVANLALASAMFVEPILFGRIVDTLASAQPRVSLDVATARAVSGESHRQT